ncbi:hypothetical protein CLV40_10138 [Actinokineospora auranticolor]|uniref:Uncharacterized protein n=1 Tax=Actinokineospora auranticolor TaxID=155976 RepID=A0A2S6H027_9PSEU|nr:hypothetical protein CLV40_10138 [Actinokineospora auranticolor]
MGGSRRWRKGREGDSEARGAGDWFLPGDEGGRTPCGTRGSARRKRWATAVSGADRRLVGGGGFGGGGGWVNRVRGEADRVDGVGRPEGVRELAVAIGAVGRERVRRGCGRRKGRGRSGGRGVGCGAALGVLEGWGGFGEGFGWVGGVARRSRWRRVGEVGPGEPAVCGVVEVVREWLSVGAGRWGSCAGWGGWWLGEVRSRWGEGLDGVGGVRAALAMAVGSTRLGIDGPDAWGVWWGLPGFRAGHLEAAGEWRGGEGAGPHPSVGTAGADRPRGRRAPGWTTVEVAWSWPGEPVAVRGWQAHCVLSVVGLIIGCCYPCNR